MTSPITTTCSVGSLNGMECAAVAVLKRAVELDRNNKLLEALTCYREGMSLLMDVIRGYCECSTTYVFDKSSCLNLLHPVLFLLSCHDQLSQTSIAHRG